MSNLVVTFADARMDHMHRRFRKQAKQLRVFDRVLCLSEQDLDASFVSEFREILVPETRGFGYFVWKPQVILQALKLAKPDDVLLYLDSGSHLVASGHPRFMDYVRIVKESASGILAFELDFIVNGHTHLEKEWSKADLFEHLQVLKLPEVVNTPQIQAGVIFIHQRPGVEQFFEEWLGVFRHSLTLVDDSPSMAPNFEEFRSHRHDQSVFSVLGKLRGISLLSASEQYPSGSPPDWSSLSRFPIHNRRDKKDFCQKIASRAREAFQPVEILLVRVKKLVLRAWAFIR